MNYSHFYFFNIIQIFLFNNFKAEQEQTEMETTQKAPHFENQ